MILMGRRASAPGSVDGSEPGEDLLFSSVLSDFFSFNELSFFCEPLEVCALYFPQEAKLAL